ncbi:hypothetical protein G6F35_019070 [Rhizopus arrhizus]|nr:hypothetical protein G6F35_019070 [Rhizopus arrhizus]
MSSTTDFDHGHESKSSCQESHQARRQGARKEGNRRQTRCEARSKEGRCRQEGRCCTQGHQGCPEQDPTGCLHR